MKMSLTYQILEDEPYEVTVRVEAEDEQQCVVEAERQIYHKYNVYGEGVSLINAVAL